MLVNFDKNVLISHLISTAKIREVSALSGHRVLAQLQGNCYLRLRF